MKLANINLGGGITYGAISDNCFYEVEEKIKKEHPTLNSLIANNSTDSSAIQFSFKKERIPVINLNFLPPISESNKVICVGINYPKIYNNIPTKKPKNIILFSKFHETLVGHNDSLRMPLGLAEASFDYEGEIAIVIGKSGYGINESKAMEHLFGYTMFNDGSVRDWQKHSIHAGKNFFCSGSCGPFIVTKDEIPTFESIVLETKLNGNTVQKSSTRAMFFNLQEIISYVSSIIPLHSGDIIATGSPEGTGANQTPPRFLREGDILEISGTNLGTLKNFIKKI